MTESDRNTYLDALAVSPGACFPTGERLLNPAGPVRLRSFQITYKMDLVEGQKMYVEETLKAWTKEGTKERRILRKGRHTFKKKSV